MEERSFYTRKVIGSNPIFLTNSKFISTLFGFKVNRRWREGRLSFLARVWGGLVHLRRFNIAYNSLCFYY